MAQDNLSEGEYDDKLYKLHPLTGKPKNKLPIVGFDVETAHVKSDLIRVSGKITPCWEQKFILGAVVWDNNEKVFHNREEMAEFLLSRQFRDSLILATHLEFDMGILYPNIHERFKIIFRQNLKGAIYTEKSERNIEDKKYERKRNWLFGDTMNYLPVGVEGLGKIIGVPKMEKPKTMEYNENALGILSRVPENQEEWKELGNYCLNDARITYLFGNKFKEFCTVHNMKMKLTLPGCGIDFWRRNYQKEVMIREPKRYLLKHFDGSFKGGMTVLYKRGQVPDKLYAFDLNSAYAYAMTVGTDGKGSYPNPSSFMYREKMSVEHIEKYDGITNCTVNMPYIYCPPLGLKDKLGKLSFPIGKFKGWFTNLELRNSMNIGAEIEPHEGIFYTQNWIPFKEAAEYLYKLRMQYGKSHYYYQMVKTLLNSGLFGRWGMNFMHMEDIFSARELMFAEDGSAYRIVNGQREKITSYELRDLTNSSSVCLVEKEGKPQKTSFPILASYTTAICRTHLWNRIKDYSSSLIYSDTDSAFMTKNVFENDEKTLGAFKLEKESSDSMIAALKMYRIDDKCRSKGVGKYMSTPETFNRALETKSVDMIQWLRLKSGWRANKSPGSILKINKHFKLDDTKRDWLGKKFSQNDWQDSEPLKVNNGEVIG